MSSGINNMKQNTRYTVEYDFNDYVCYICNHACACLPEKSTLKWCMYAEYSKVKENTVNTRFPTGMHMLCSVGAKPDQLTTTIVCY